MLYNDKEEKFLRILLHKPDLNQTGSSENELEAAAKMFFRSLRDRGVTAQTIISGNGNGSTDAAKVAILEQLARNLEATNRLLRGDVRRHEETIQKLRTRATGDYSKGYAEGFEKGQASVPKEEPQPQAHRSSGRAYRPNPEAAANKTKWEAIARDFDGESEDFVMEFGKFKGNKLRDVSLNYLEWAVGPKGLTDMPNTVGIIEDYLDEVRRNRR